MSVQAIRPSEAIDEAFIAKLVMANAREYAIIVLDDAGAIRSWSVGAERVFGYDASEMVGQPVDRLFLAPDVAADAPRQELDRARQNGRAEDSRWHLRKDGERFWANGVTMRLDEGAARGFLKILRDETASKLADEQRVLLLNELNHRIKNTLATVQSITEQTLRAAKVDLPIRQSLTNRLLALSKAHDVLVAESWAGASLHSLIDETVALHRREDTKAFEVDGPPVRLSPQQAVSLSLVLHELATNSIKYGALSVADGCVRITWNVAQDGEGRRNLTLLWRESGGPVVRPPEQTGFGSRLIAQTFGREGAGRTRIEYPPEGVRCVVEAPLSTADEIPLLDMVGR